MWRGGGNTSGAKILAKKGRGGRWRRDFKHGTVAQRKKWHGAAMELSIIISIELKVEQHSQYCA